MPVPPLNITEQVKLGATLCNTLAAGCVTVGIIAPLAYLLTTPVPISDDRTRLLLAMGVALLIAAAVLHILGQALLNRFLEDTDVDQ